MKNQFIIMLIFVSNLKKNEPKIGLTLSIALLNNNMLKFYLVSDISLFSAIHFLIPPSNIYIFLKPDF